MDVIQNAMDSSGDKQFWVVFNLGQSPHNDINRLPSGGQIPVDAFVRSELEKARIIPPAGTADKTPLRSRGATFT